MQITFEIDSSQPVLIAKTHLMAVDLEKIPSNLWADLFYHGLKQKVSDAGALPAGSSPDDKLARAVLVRDTLYEGNWSRRGESSEPGLDPVERMARDLCRVNAKESVLGKNRKKSDKATDEQAARIDAIVDKNWEKFVESAKRTIEDRKTRKEIVLDM